MTQKDVAKRAGVSFITVSRVINNQNNVQENTRRRVLEAIRELGYYPNHLGQALNSGKSNTIGIVTPIRFHGGLEANMYLIGLLDGIERACRENHLDLLLSTESLSDADFDFLRPYHQKKVDGVVFIGLQKMDAASISEIETQRIPCVVISDRPNSDGISWVDSDNEQAGYESGRQLLALGHRQIAYLGIDTRELHNQNIEDRCAGLRRAMAEAGIAWDQARNYLTGDFSEASGAAAFREIHTWGEQRPTAVFCGTDAMALGLIQAAIEAGVRVPDDLSVVGFDAFPLGRHSRPTLSSNEQPLKEMGFAAVSLLLGHIADPQSPRQKILLPNTFLKAGSIGPVNGAVQKKLE